MKALCQYPEHYYRPEYSHPTMPVFMTLNVRNRDHGVVKQTNKQTGQNKTFAKCFILRYIIIINNEGGIVACCFECIMSAYVIIDSM